MKNIETILKEVGIEIPTEQADAFKKAFNENYKTIAEHEKIKSDNEELKNQLKTAQDAIKGFEDVKPEELKSQVEAWKKKAEDAENEYKQKIADRDFEDAIKDAIGAAGGLNHKAISALLDKDALKASKNQKADMEAAIKALTEADDSKFLFKTAQTEPTQPPKFTRVSGKSTASGEIKSRDDIYAKDEHGRYKLDAQQRQQAIMDHPELFN